MRCVTAIFSAFVLGLSFAGESDGQAPRKVATLEKAAGPLCFSPNGSVVAANVLLRIETKREFRIIGQASGPLPIPPFPIYGDWKVGEEWVQKRWDTTTWKVIETRKELLPAALMSSEDGKQYAGIGPKGVEVWDAVADKMIANLPRDSKSLMTLPLAFSRDKKMLALMQVEEGEKRKGTSTKVVLWKVGSKELTAQPSDPALPVIDLDAEWPSLLETEGVSLADVAEGKARAKIEFKIELFGDLQEVAPGRKAGAKVAGGGFFRGNAKNIELHVGNKTLLLKGHERAVTALAFAPDGKTLASGDATGMIRLWGVALGNEQMTFRASSEGVNSIVFSPDGRFLCTGHSSGIVVWDLKIGD